MSCRVDQKTTLRMADSRVPNSPQPQRWEHAPKRKWITSMDKVRAIGQSPNMGLYQKHQTAQE